MPKKKDPAPDFRKMLRIGLNDIDVTAFEKELATFLSKQCRHSDLGLAELKDIIWNSLDHNLSSRLAFLLSDQNPKTKIEEILNMVMNAWNYFPHRALNGLSPNDMTERLSDDAEFTPEDRWSLYEFFEDQFPEEPRIQNWGEHIWSWEFPAFYHTLLDELTATQENLTGLEIMPGDEAGAMQHDALVEILLMSAEASLREYPLHFEAAIIVAQDKYQGGDHKAARGVLEDAIFAGRRVFPASFVLGVDRLPWGYLDNRPFLKMLGEYATLLEHLDGATKAIPYFEELIELNPNDNQGNRSLLATAYLKTGQLEKILELSTKYKDDLMAELLIGSVLALFKLGRLDEAKAKVKEITKYSANIFKEILKSDHPQPKLLPGRVQVGGEDEAWLYWQAQGTFWMVTPGARDFLRDCIAKEK